jgi:hypothetical protein
VGFSLRWSVDTRRRRQQSVAAIDGGKRPPGGPVARERCGRSEAGPIDDEGDRGW